MNFKVGDRVRCVNPAGNDHINKGEVFVIEEVNSDGVKVFANGELRFYFSNQFELANLGIGDTVPFDELYNYIGWTVECRSARFGMDLTARGVLHITARGEAITPEYGLLGDSSGVFTLVSPPPVDPDEDVLTLLDKWNAKHAEPRKMSKVTLQKIRGLGLEVTVKDSE